MLNGLGISTGIDLERLIDVGQWISGVLERDYGSRAGKALATKRRKSSSR